MPAHGSERLVADMRSAIEAELKGRVYTQGVLRIAPHIDLVDGSLDTEDMARDVVKSLTALGWEIKRKVPHA
jgi:hypothetical protein